LASTLTMPTPQVKKLFQRTPQIRSPKFGSPWRHQKSSHCVFIRADGRTLSVPAHRPIKPIYIRKFIELIDGATP